MDDARWEDMMLGESEDCKLTQDEIDAGWHYCSNWDGLLVGPGMAELNCCTCEEVKF